MRRLKTTVLAVVPALVVALAGVLTPGVARAAFTGYAASDVLGQPDFTSSGNAASTTALDYPAGSTLDATNHRLFVADSDNNRVLVYNLDSSNNLMDHVADNVLGQPDFTSNAGAIATQNGMNFPYEGLVFDPATNRLFVTDGANARILVFDLSTGITDGMNASFVLGQPDFATRAANVTQNGLSFYVAGMSYDATTKYLYVGDESAHRVVVYDLSGGINNGMNASFVLGQPNFTSSSQATTQSGMKNPYNVFFEPSAKRLFVSDQGNSRVLVFDLSGGISNGMNASNVIGQSDFTSGSRSISQSTVEFPDGIAYDTSGKQLFVTQDNSSDSRIMVFDLSNGITDGMNASMEIGAPDFSAFACTVTQTSLCDPEGNLAFDQENRRLYITDSNNNRVMIFNMAKLASDVNDPAVGDSYSQWMGSQFQGTPTFSVTAGALPPGLTLDASSGLLSGVFTQAGAFNFTIQLVDNNGAAGSFTDTHSYTLVVDPAVAAAGAATLSNTGLNIGLGSGLGVILISAATFIYRKRNNLYRLWGWEP